MAEENNSYIFRCTNKTQKECFDRLLFGEKEKYRSRMSHLREGDKIYLYNIDTEMLHGSFCAKSDGATELEPMAWGGGFPVQVRVERIVSPIPLHKEDIKNILNFHFAYGKFYPDPTIDLHATQQIERLLNSDERNVIVIAPDRLEKPTRKTLDGHYVRSQWECDIDNWLSDKLIYHVYEKTLNIPERMMCDFYIPKGVGNCTEDIYIELWGLKNQKYLTRKQTKIELYKKYNLNLIELFQEDMQDLDRTLGDQLRKFGVITKDG